MAVATPIIDLDLVPLDDIFTGTYPHLHSGRWQTVDAGSSARIICER